MKWDFSIHFFRCEHETGVEWKGIEWDTVRLIKHKDLIPNFKVSFENKFYLNQFMYFALPDIWNRVSVKWIIDPVF